MTPPEEMIAWLDRRIASAMTWLDDHGRTSKRPRPIDLIEIKEYDIARFHEVRGTYLNALNRRRTGGDL